MHKQLSNLSKQLQSFDRRAAIRRAMWIDFEKRLRSVFIEIKQQQEHAEVFGRFYLSTSAEFYGKTDFEKISSFNLLNFAQISTGHRILNFSHKIKSKNNKIKLGSESGAALTFSQSPNGCINVILYPYSSDLASTKEDNIIIDINLEPHTISEKKIRNYFLSFLRYCVASSASSFGDFTQYRHRLWLLMLDYRHRKAQSSKIYPLIEKSLMAILAALGVWATLLTGGKWPL